MLNYESRPRPSAPPRRAAKAQHSRGSTPVGPGRALQSLRREPANMKKTLKMVTVATYALAVLGGWHSEAAAGGSEVSVTRLVVADGVSEREPIGVATEFSIADTERLFAFVEVSNPSAVATEILISWIDSATGTAHR